MDYKKSLIEKIDKLLKGDITVPEFEEEYYLFYLNEVPEEGAMSDDDYHLFGDIQEQLDFSSKNPTPEEKNDGIMDYEEYVQWLKEKIGKIR